MEIENQASFKHALLHGVNVFVGAGFSVLAKDAAGRSMPVGGTLAAELRAEFDLQGTEDLPLPQLYTLLARTRRERVDAYLRDRFTVAKFDDRYLHLHRVQASTLFTTNIDTLLQKIYENSSTAYLNDIDLSGPTYSDRRAIDLVMLHGSVVDGRRPLRFGTLEIASSFSADPDRWRYFRQRLTTSPTVFLGYSLQDAAALEALRADGGGTLGDVWIQLRPEDARSAVADYFRALDFQIVEADTHQLLNWFSFNLPNPVDSLPRNKATADTRSLFPGEAIPVPGSVASRPVVDFFEGASPAWSDVFSIGLHKVSHYRVAVEKVRKGSPTIITGIPGAGKTTLLMQIMSSIEFEGHKLILDGVSKSRAELLVRVLDGAPALIALDNLANDADAFSVLRSAPGVTVVGAERDYNLSSALHRLDKREVVILDVTELTDADLQDLRSTIPEAIRKSALALPETSEGIRPSLFEFVQANVRAPTLHERFRRALQDLQRSSPQLAEMLLLSAYVHSCRTPLSMDMAIGYWHGRIKSYDDVYKLIRDVGALLSEYEGDLAEGDQDHFAARSVIAAEAVLSAASREQLADLLRTFHSNLSPARITAYYVFKRRCYDSRLFLRAFSDTDEAVHIYDAIYVKSPDPYVLQQKGLLLAGRKRYPEAFQVMDRAVATAPKTNWTIRSSYAQILFRANINLAGTDSAVRALLDRAMSSIAECHEKDRRRAMHALNYGRLAIEYSSVFTDTLALEYLSQAEEWLAAVIVEEPWIRAAPYVRADVDRARRTLS